MFYYNEEINQFESPYDFLHFIFMTGFSNISKNLYFSIINKNNQVSNFEEISNEDYFDKTYMIDSYQNIKYESNNFINMNSNDKVIDNTNKSNIKDSKVNDISPHDRPNLLDTIPSKFEQEGILQDDKISITEPNFSSNNDDDYNINSIIVERINFNNNLSTVNKEAKYKKISYHYDKLDETSNNKVNNTNKKDRLESKSMMRNQHNSNNISDPIKIVVNSSNANDQSNDKVLSTEPQFHSNSKNLNLIDSEEFNNFKVYNSDEFNEEDMKKTLDHIFFPEKYKYSKCSIL